MSITNILVRFKPDKSYNLIPFNITLQDSVSEVHVHILSNIDALSGDYTIYVR